MLEVPLARPLLLALFVVSGLVFGAVWWRTELARSARRERASVLPGPRHVLVGAVTDFLDTLGIGSFATTTAALRLGKVVDDRSIPGTLNVGHTLPTVAQALIYVTIVEVDMATLMVMIVAAVCGAWIGAGTVSRWSRRWVQVAIGSGMVAATGLMVCTAIGLLPKGGDSLSLGGLRLATGAVVNFALGALMTAGIGLYAPCMILVSLLGMNPTAAFPIMMGSCALLMTVASTRFVRTSAYDLRAALGLTLGGAPAVFVAAFLVRALPLAMVRWLIIGVAAYTAATLLDAARRDA